VSCPDRVPAPITSVAAGARKCQEAIAKEAATFLKLQMTQLANCRLKQPAGTCPTSKETEKIEKAAIKATDKIAKACGDDAAQSGLTSSYASGTDDAVISSCLLSQHNVVGALVVANATGTTTEAWPNQTKERGKCLKEISKSATLFVTSALANAANCVKTQMKNAVAGDLAPVCIGSFSGGSFVPPTDAKTAQKQDKLVQKIEANLAKKCAAAETDGSIATIFACAGSSTVAELQQCTLCTGWGAVMDALAQQYSETGSYVANGAGALQAAVDAASAGSKLLIGSGDYAEEVLIAKDNLSLVGCGGARNNRPRIVPPPVEAFGQGIRANGVNGLLFQSLSVFGQQNDGLRITAANGVTFRDIVADGNLASAYAIFPRTCNNVLIELSEATRCRDAPLYVGQSSGVVVRFNEVRDSVAAIEIENCGNAEVYNNYTTNNTAGLLVFKDGSLPVQLSQCHAVHHNLFENNNTPNFGTGTVALVPDGTGILVISNDTTPFHHNISRGHNTFGLALTDQVFSEFGPPFSADQAPQQNYFFSNIITGNGGTPDFAFGADVLAVATSDLVGGGNCQSDNIYGTEILFTALPACTLPPPSFPTCPAPSVP
jgi:parallel beta-helix repeat protein